MNPMLIPLMMYRGWLQMFFPKPNTVDEAPVGYEG